MTNLFEDFRFVPISSTLLPVLPTGCPLKIANFNPFRLSCPGFAVSQVVKARDSTAAGGQDDGAMLLPGNQ